MNVLVVYGSHLGSTAGIAEEIADTIRAETTALVSVQPASTAGPIDAYDAVVVGGGTYAGRWHPDSVAFVRRNATELRARKVWFFSSGPVGDQAASAPNPLAPVELKALAELTRPQDQVVFAGSHDRSEVHESELTRLEKFIARRFVPQGDWRDWTAIEGWARTIARELEPRPLTVL